MTKPVSANVPGTLPPVALRNSIWTAKLAHANATRLATFARDLKNGTRRLAPAYAGERQNVHLRNFGIPQHVVANVEKLRLIVRNVIQEEFGIRM